MDGIEVGTLPNMESLKLTSLLKNIHFIEIFYHHLDCSIKICFIHL
jgi:hypothetical protein